MTEKETENGGADEQRKAQQFIEQNRRWFQHRRWDQGIDWLHKLDEHNAEQRFKRRRRRHE